MQTVSKAVDQLKEKLRVLLEYFGSAIACRQALVTMLVPLAWAIFGVARRGIQELASVRMEICILAGAAVKDAL